MTFLTEKQLADAAQSGKLISKVKSIVPADDESRTEKLLLAINNRLVSMESSQAKHLKEVLLGLGTLKPEESIHVIQLLEKILARMEKPVGFEFTIERDRRGMSKTIKAKRID